MAAHVRIGDRLERAIEEHVDVERELERAEAHPPSPRRLLRMIVWLVITAVSLYLVAPALTSVLGSWDEIGSVGVGWLAAMAVLQTASLACLWALQRLALHAEWPAVIASQLAGNALAKIAPGGGAVGAALQYRMLVDAGAARGTAAAGLTAANALTFAMVLALPLVTLPAMVRGSVDESLLDAALIGIGVFAVLVALGGVCLAMDGPLRWIGATVQRVRNRLRRRSARVDDLPQRLLRERDRVLATIGPRWKAALLATAGRWAFDYATLLAALAAVGSRPQPALVLLAFCAAQVLAQIPATPGGLGFVEAGLAATLALAGVPAAKATFATFVYRLFSYWLPLVPGLVAFLVHRRRYPATAAAGVPEPTAET